MAKPGNLRRKDALTAVGSGGERHTNAHVDVSKLEQINYCAGPCILRSLCLHLLVGLCLCHAPVGGIRTCIRQGRAGKNNAPETRPSVDNSCTSSFCMLDSLCIGRWQDEELDVAQLAMVRAVTGHKCLRCSVLAGISPHNQMFLHMRGHTQTHIYTRARARIRTRTSPTGTSG